MGVIVGKEEFREIVRPRLKAEGKSIALCHGVFDLVHPGHIVHFEQAKGMGDVLVVSITAAQFVRKGPGRPYFNDEMRMKFLTALECIDYVMLSEGYTVDDIIEAVEPDIYVKGEEYQKASNDITGKIAEEQALVEKHGGKIQFTTGEVFSSTKLINNALAGLPEEVKGYVEDFKIRYSLKDIKEYAEQAKKLKVLVIGDTIVDKYTYCQVQGIMSKDAGYSSRLQSTEEYLGGAVAVARHLSSFTEKVTLMSVIGNEAGIKERMEEELAGKMHLELIISQGIPTIIKHRYLSRNQKREEYRKIFAINNIPDKPGYEEDVNRQFVDKLRAIIGDYDVVYLCDFGHGLVNDTVMELVQQRAKYLVLNCQTNSSNKGMNIITKYKRADVFTIDQQELELAYPSYADDERIKFIKLSKHLKGSGWLTRGASGAYGIKEGDIYECPAFTLTVKDTIGAGDAFMAVAGIFAAAGAPIEIGTFMGNIGGGAWSEYCWKQGSIGEG